MVGYNHEAGMSNNAVNAYNRGIKPLSKITKKDIAEAGLTISLSFAKWLAKEGYWARSEWHHSGGTWYNQVDFYNPQELADALEELDVKALWDEYKNSKKASKEAPEKGDKVKGTYPVWGGTKRHPKVIDTVSFNGVKKGDWIHLDNGKRKNAYGNNISWEYV